MSKISGEYFGRYKKDGQAQGPFAKFFNKMGLLPNILCMVLLFITVQQKEEIEHYHMVHSMLCSSKLPTSLWVESLKPAAYIVNRVPTKAVPKTPFQLFKGWKSSLTHLAVWGCHLQLEFTTHKKRSQILGQLVDFSLDMTKGLKDTDSTVHLEV